ncbi:hypothetical protein EV356DRAFT_504789 [Viridothelium virens]|uniref:RNA polymerase II subunit A C-terminal domain phosphatase n=1 Tax=Viridothelium virens TaxID=1048519 RepID=A0A6A6H4H2_VIRVR|nr:hypothetical protein EV356DRAFT_504789 [Viridothelium virens]
MLIVSPSNLHYPITVTKLLAQPEDNVQRNDKLFTYEYAYQMLQQDENGDDYEVVKILDTDYQCEIKGKLTTWKIAVDDEIKGPGLALVEIEEPCRHEVQFAGMCTICGEDMTEISYNQSTPDTHRASVNMFHGNTALKVSEAEAFRTQDEAMRRLLSKEKLSLVVDLDQTIIHATVDPTVAEWQNDENSPNHEAVKDVRAFKLTDDGPGVRQECWYYIKLRPGLAEFFEEISKLFECHIYTMGTRAYALHIAQIVDPDRKIFGDRILSRDESGSLQAKKLKRLFPADTKMVVIMDDRADVWEWSANLIRLPAYDFFVGIGDINASFLPKKPDADTPSPKVEKIAETQASDVDEQEVKDTEAAASTNGEHVGGHEHTDSTQQAAGDVSTLEQLVSMGGGDNVEALKEKASKQDEAIAAQLADRPLLQQQKILDAEEEKANQAAADKDQNGEAPDENTSHEAYRYRHNLLKDDDEELIHLEVALRKVHATFYNEYKQQKAGHPGESHLSLLPDIKNIMPAMKERVLRDVNMVFSGIMPLNVDVQMSDRALWAKSFGASVSSDITKRTTHVIATPQRKTSKVRKALRHPNRIKVVTEAWLFNCFTIWRHLDEKPYLIDFGPDQQDVQNGTDTPFGQEQALLSSEDEDSGPTTDADDEGDGAPDVMTGRNPGLRIETGEREEEDEEDLSKYAPNEDEKSPMTPMSGDWKGIDDELREFMGSDYEDSDESDGPEDSEMDEAGETNEQMEQQRDNLENGVHRKSLPVLSGKRKRKRVNHSGRSTDGEDSDASTALSNDGPNLRRPKRKALDRTSSLTNSNLCTEAIRGGSARGDGSDTESLALERAFEQELQELSDQLTEEAGTPRTEPNKENSELLNVEQDEG